MQGKQPQHKELKKARTVRQEFVSESCKPKICGRDQFLLQQFSKIVNHTLNH